MLRETALPGLDNTVSEFSYDPLGCLTRAHNSHAQLRFQYNPLGQVISESQAGRLTTRYAYDSDNRLIRAETPDGVSQYRYDPLGRRIAKVTPEGETRFAYDGARLLQETRAERCRTYLFEPGGFRPLACIDQAGGAASQVYYYHLDHLGTPRELTDTTGKIVWSARYRAYGSLALADVADIDNPLRFQGQYFDAETGLHYNLHRYYDPQAGRFIHQDPIGLAGGLNPYQYVPNPTGWVDPFGLTCKENTWNEFQKHHKRQFGNSTEAAAAYKSLIDKQSPWPIEFEPPEATLIPGTKMNMAMSPGQASSRPGGFATFDDIQNVDYVRNELAVKEAWKPSIDRVVTYEVTQPLPVRIGPVGPQIDQGMGKYLPGGGSQVEMMVNPVDRMNYLKVIDEQPIE
ncbi:RHS repeat-associated core domain-containing protein [Methylobacter marinus]|uniref:RHS repeat-associated core domain-containing protein n=2 Tax=Methylobacter marinus TaxID=34058 RepID=UPI00036D7AEC|nr:RHS repeat-associated core domain-containing protein [Methylobacter marinus]